MERIICLLIGYACGLFQTAYIMGKIYHTDIRKQGSGNLGSTNVMRTLGKKAGALNLLCDCLKCVAAILIVRALFRGQICGYSASVEPVCSSRMYPGA